MAISTLLVGGCVAIVVLVAFSAFFSSSEIAIFTIPEDWIESQATTGETQALHLAELRRDPHRLLVTILVGNNIVNVAISSIITAILVIHLPAGWAVTIATIVASSIVLVFGEIVPKSYGLGNATTWALTVAGPLTYVERSLYPLVLVFDGITRRLNAVLGGDQDIEEPYLAE